MPVEAVAGAMAGIAFVGGVAWVAVAWLRRPRASSRR